MMEMLMLACAISQAMAFAPVLPSCSHLAGGRSLHAGCRGGGLQLRASPRRAALLALSMLIEGSAVENVDAGAIKVLLVPPSGLPALVARATTSRVPRCADL